MLTLKWLFLSIFITVFIKIESVAASENIYQFITSEGDVIVDSALVRDGPNEDKIQFIELLKKIDFVISPTPKEGVFKIESYMLEPRLKTIDFTDYPTFEQKKDLEATEFWLSTDDFEKIFPLKLIKNSQRLIYIVESTKPQTGGSSLFLRKNKIREVSDDQLEWQKWGSPNFDYSVFMDQNHQGDRNLSTDLTFNGPLLKHDAQASFYSNNNQINFNMTLSKTKRKEADLLGPLKASYYELGSVVLPGMEHVAGQSYVVGFGVNNRLNEMSLLFFEKTLLGVTRPLWQVYLYLNESLIATTQANEQGQYLLTDIPYYQGINKLKFLFKGPLGQEYSEEKIYEYDNSFSSQQKINYEYSFGQSRAHNLAQVLKIDKSLSSWLSFNLSDYNSSDNNSSSSMNINYIQPHLKLRYLQLNTDLYSTFLNSPNSTAYGISQKFITEQSHLKIDYSTFDRNFRSDLINFNQIYKEKTELNAEGQVVIPFLRSYFYLNYLQKTFYDEYIQDKLISGRLFASSYWGYGFYSHEWHLDSGLPQDNSFEIGVLKNLNKFQLNGSHIGFVGTQYDFLFEHQWNDLFSIGALTGVNEDQSRDYWGGYTSYKFPAVSLFFKTQYDKNKEWYLKFGLTGSVYDSQEKEKYQMEYSRRSKKAQVQFNLFIDSNKNGVYDESEKKLSQVQLINQLTAMAYTSDGQGRVFVTDIEAYQPQNFSVKLESIPNIYLTPVSENIDFILTSGQYKIIDVPFYAQSELEGEINSKFAFKDKIQLKVELPNEKSKLYDIKDRRFNLKLNETGFVRIELVLSNQDRNTFKISPEFYNLNIAETGQYISDLNFQITARQKVKRVKKKLKHRVQNR